MQAHALSVLSKHMPESVSQWQGRVGFWARSKPGLHAPSLCDGSESDELDLPALPVAGLEGAPALDSELTGSEWSSIARPPHANSPTHPSIKNPSGACFIVLLAMWATDPTDHFFRNVSLAATRLARQPLHFGPVCDGSSTPK